MIPTLSTRRALRSYLASKLATAWPELKVFEQWPYPSRPLPKQAISIVATGAMQLEEHEPVIWDATPTTAPNGMVLYSYGRAWIGLQLDVWATSEDNRDRISDDLRSCLNRSPVETLATPGAFTELRNHGGLVLYQADAYNVTAEYKFHTIPTIAESSFQASNAEWRATWQGTAMTYIMAQETLALMKQITTTINSEDYTLTAP